MPVYLPEKSVITKLEAQLAPIDAEIRKNDDEIRVLEELRDALLPKLMSGEIDASEFDLESLSA